MQVGKSMKWEHTVSKNNRVKGVVDTSDTTFYGCERTGHWSKIMEIISQKYPRYDEALLEMYGNEKVMEWNGITRKELDSFILERFELIGGNTALKEYLKK